MKDLFKMGFVRFFFGAGFGSFGCFLCVAFFLPLVPTFSVSFHCNTPAILVEKLFDSYTLFTIDRQFILFLFPLFPRHGYTNLNNVGNLFGEKREENREHTNEYGSECDNVSVIS